MSKFFADDNDSQSDKDSNDSQNEHVDKFKNQAQKAILQKRKDIMQDLESSEDEGHHVVVSEKQKRCQKMKQTIVNMKKKMNINDFVSLLTEFEELNKEMEKGQKIFEKEGGIPRFYIRALCILENHVMGLSAEEKKKLSQNNNKSYNILKQKIKKHNQNFEKEIKEFLENPIDSEAEKAQELLLKKQKEKKLGQQNQAINDNQQEEEDDDDDELDDQVDDEESDEDDKYLLESNDPMVRRRYWLKKSKDSEAPVEEERQRRPKVSQKKQIDYEVKFQIQEAEDIKIDYSQEGVSRLLSLIVESRARPGNQHQNIYICEKLIKHFLPTDLKKTLEILLITIQLQIDQAKAEGMFYINRKAWTQIYQNFSLLYKIYHEQGLSFESLNSYSKFDRENSFTAQKFQDAMYITFQTLETELTKAFQNLDVNAQEYSERVSDLYKLIYLASKFVNLFKSKRDSNNLSRMSFKYLELCYNFSQPLIQRLQHENTGASPKVEDVFPDDINKLVEQLTMNVYKGNDEDHIKKATLYRVYNLALNDKYSQARDLLQKSISQETASAQRLMIQILYNRALVQLGVSAFKQGQIVECHQHLQDIVSKDKDKNVRDLLAQNYTRLQTDPDYAKYMVPYHNAINVDLVDAIYYISAMLLEVPNIHQNPFDDGQKVISKKFRQLCNYHDNQPYNIYPENIREQIYQASKYLGRGDWKECWTIIEQLQFWTRVQNAPQVQERLLNVVKEQALKCFLFTFKQSFSVLSLSHLLNNFELKPQQVKRVVFKLIYQRDLNARIEGEDGNLQIVFFQQEVSSIYKIVRPLMDKISLLTRDNEKLLDAKVGSYGFQSQAKDAQETSLKQKQRKKKTPSKFSKTKNIVNKKKQ